MIRAPGGFFQGDNLPVLMFMTSTKERQYNIAAPPSSG